MCKSALVFIPLRAYFNFNGIWKYVVEISETVHVKHLAQNLAHSN